MERDTEQKIGNIIYRFEKKFHDLERVGNRDISDYKVLGRRDLFLDPSVRLKVTHELL
ncbi:uncharacterized protein LOC111831120 [Capsella rubella]|uniref:uncharacterized protein LOC111831120 n=1 Tax=Capsella rubella TaxID=81985 RepID=UPI000CD4A3CC|nr:uncharacterized protein LOC111831120 [Capsella rubella]